MVQRKAVRGISIRSSRVRAAEVVASIRREAEMRIRQEAAAIGIQAILRGRMGRNARDEAVAALQVRRRVAATHIQASHRGKSGESLESELESMYWRDNPE